MENHNGRLYTVYIETTRAPGAPMPVVGAISPEGAGEVVRILLAQGDKTISQVIIKVEQQL